MTKYLKRLYYTAGSAFTAGMLMASTPAAAQEAATGGGGGNTISSISNAIVTSVGDVPGLIAVVAMLLGLLTGLMGILKIKDHVEKPDQVELKEGAIRLAAGGALLSLPFIYDVITTTIDAGTTASAPAAIQLNAAGTGLL
jgi:hypothetical protein